jgi:DNA invertase Pin-like site-specific DNA recombinase
MTCWCLGCALWALGRCSIEGEIGHLHVGLTGTVNALHLKRLREETRRGLRGRVEAGKSGGGVSFGYRVVRVLEGQPRGDRAIHPDEAETVRRIFRASPAWRNQPKWVVSRSLKSVGPNARLVEDDISEVWGAA